MLKCHSHIFLVTQLQTCYSVSVWMSLESRIGERFLLMFSKARWGWGFRFRCRQECFRWQQAQIMEMMGNWNTRSIRMFQNSLITQWSICSNAGLYTRWSCIGCIPERCNNSLLETTLETTHTIYLGIDTYLGSSDAFCSLYQFLHKEYVSSWVAAPVLWPYPVCLCHLRLLKCYCYVFRASCILKERRSVWSIFPIQTGGTVSR